MLTLLLYLLPAFAIMFLSGRTLFHVLPTPIQTHFSERLPHVFILQALGFASFIGLTILINRFIPNPTHSLIISGFTLVAGAIFYNKKRKYLLFESLLSFMFLSVVFFIFLYLRGHFSTIHYNPQESGAEKFFNLSILQSLSISKEWPPENIWYAKEPLQYYLGTKAYAGWVLRFLNPSLENTAFVFHMMEALHHTLAFLCTYFVPVAILNILHKKPTISNKIIAFSLNPYFAYPLFSLLTGTDAVSHWDLTRVIPGTINEYPFWNFSWADGHAHTGSAFLLSLFFYLLFLMNQFKSHTSVPIILAWLSSFIVLSQNPSVLTVAICSITFFAITLKSKQQLKNIILFSICSLLFTLPEALTHQYPQTQTNFVPFEMTTQIEDLIIVHFISLFIPYLLYFSMTAGAVKSLIFIIFTTLLYLFPTPFHSATLWAIATSALILYKSKPIERLAVIPIVLLIFPEVIVSDFNHSESMLRWNTVFKFYYDLYFIAPIFILVPTFVVFQNKIQFETLQKSIIFPVLSAVAIGFALLSHYLTLQKNTLSHQDWKLTGFDYLEHQNKFVHETSLFLMNHKGVNIVEACGIAPNPASYSEYGRVSALSATRTVCGWSSHTLLHSKLTESHPRIGNHTYYDHLHRESQIQSLFTFRDQTRWSFIKSHNIKYITLGRLEKRIPGVKSPMELESEYGKIVLQVGEEALIEVTPEKIPGKYE